MPLNYTPKKKKGMKSPEEKAFGGGMVQGKHRALRGLRDKEDDQIKMMPGGSKKRVRNARMNYAKLDTFFNTFRNTQPMARFGNVDHFVSDGEAQRVMNAIVDHQGDMQRAFNAVYASQ